MVRYFHQSPDYWLDHCTLQDWREIWSRELREMPPVDEWAAIYFKYEPLRDEGADDEAATSSDDPEIWECPFPEMTE